MANVAKPTKPVTSLEDAPNYVPQVANVKAEEPTFTGSYAERQKQWIEHHGLKVGDKVKVVRKFKTHEGGVNAVWAQCKDDAVGSVRVITSLYYKEVGLKGDVMNAYPYFVLEPVA